MGLRIEALAIFAVSELTAVSIFTAVAIVVVAFLDIIRVIAESITKVRGNTSRAIVGGVQA